jgi:hypothetical protein
MTKRRVGNQIGSLTHDHKKLGIDLIYLRAGGVRHTIEKLLTRATALLATTLQSEIYTTSCGSSNGGNFRAPTWESRYKKPFGCGLRGEVQNIL